MSENVVKAIGIPAGEKKNAKGEEVGDDWLLATFGCDDDGTEWYLTTDQVHASEFGWLVDHLDIDPKGLAEKVSSMLNDEFERLRKK